MNASHYANIFTASSAASPFSEVTMIVSPGFETNVLLDSIYAAPLDKIGSDKFMQTYCVNLERLSIQAHLTAGMLSFSQSNAVEINCNATSSLGNALTSLGGGLSEEYIVEAFLDNATKLEDLIKTLLALEYWKENVLFQKGNGSNECDGVEFDIEGGEREDEVSLNTSLANIKNYVCIFRYGYGFPGIARWMIMHTIKNTVF